LFAKTFTKHVNNVDLTVSITGLDDSWYVTGTGVGLTGGVSATIDPNSPDTSWNRIEIHEVNLDAAAAGSGNLYPLPGMVPPVVAGKGGLSYSGSFSRSARFDSTKAGGSIEGQAMVLKVTAKFTLRKVKIQPVPYPPGGVAQVIDLEPPREESAEVTVTVKAVNALLVNSTIRNVNGGGGMAPYNLPADFQWGAVSSMMAAAGKSGLSNHASLPGDIQTRMQMKGDDLFPNATSWMNSSHGMLSGVTTDQSSPSTGLDSVGWSEITAKVGIVNASPTRLLQLNTVLLYSYDCGSFNGLASALFGATAINQAAFAFPGTIFTMLKAGDASFEVDLNDEHGTVLLTDKLDKHVSRVTSQLMSEKTASEAAENANLLFTPRTFSRVNPSNPAINLMKRLDLLIKGDGNAMVNGVYKPADPDIYVQYGAGLIVFKGVVQ